MGFALFLVSLSQGNPEERHAVRSGSRRVEITIGFNLTLGWVPEFKLFWRGMLYAFGTISTSHCAPIRYDSTSVLDFCLCLSALPEITGSILRRLGKGWNRFNGL
jgi:hypothetical protein